MAGLRLGVYRLPTAEAGLVRALVALAQGDDGFRWIYAHEGPFDAVIADASADAPGPGSSARVVGLLGDARSAPVAGVHSLTRPLHLEQLETWLRHIEPALAQPAAARRFRLKRWPPHALLRSDARHLRMAAFLARRALRPDELSALSGLDVTRCAAFAAQLRQQGLLLPDGGSGAGSRHRTGVAARLRHRLGLEQP